MLRRAWLVLCGLWAALMLLIGMLSYDTEWPKVFALAAAPIIAGTLVVFALRWASSAAMAGRQKCGSTDADLDRNHVLPLRCGVDSTLCASQAPSFSWSARGLIFEVAPFLLLCHFGQNQHPRAL